MTQTGTGTGHRFRRWLALFIVLTMLASVLPMVSGSYQAKAQEGSGWDIGEPPDESGIALASATDPGSIDLAASLSVDVRNRENVRNFYLGSFDPVVPSYGYTGNVANCTAGTISSTYRQYVLEQIAWYRAMAGVPSDIALSTTYNNNAQEAALIMAANGALSHFPPQGWDCWTQTGYEAAGSSNLHISWRWSTAPITNPARTDVVTGYMIDPQGNNTEVGHRRWLIHPPTQTFGVGDAEYFFNDGVYNYRHSNAIWVQDPNTSGAWSTRDGFISWPPAGYVPYQTTFPRWHFTLPNANFSGATVTVTKDGAPYSISIEEQHVEGFVLGDSIVWLMSGYSGDDQTFSNPGTDDHYEITISNVMVGGSPMTYTYDVVVIDPAQSGGGSLASANLDPSSAVVGAEIDFDLTDFPANSVVSAKLNTSSTTSIDLGDVNTNASGDASGSFTVPSLPEGVYQVEFESGNTSATDSLEILRNLELLTPFTDINGAATLRVTGFPANAPLWIEWQDPDNQVFYLVQSPVTDDDGQGTFNVPVPFFAESGVQHIRVRVQGTGESLQTDDLVIVTNPPNAVTEGALDLQTTTPMTEVDLDGSGSTGADGANIESWEWSIEGETIASGEITSAELPIGTHNIILTITDEFGLTDTAPLTVTITIADQSAIANAGPDQEVPSAGATTAVTLDGSASEAAPGTTITSYSWTLEGQQSPIATGVNPTVMLPNGLHTITLTVTTNFATTSTDTVQIRVSEPPTADAGDDQIVDTWTSSAQVTLDGSGSIPPPASSITEYRWTGLPGGDRTGVNPSVTLPVGSHTATLTVTASNGMTDTDTVSITVNQLGQPSVTIDPDRAAPAAVISYEIDNFPRGSNVAITWTTNFGVVSSLGSVSIDESNGATGSISVPAGPGGPGSELTFTLGSVSVSTEVEVRPRISPSVTTAAPGQTITVNLRGFARFDDVLIRWKVGNSWVNVGTATTSSTGSVTNKAITIPENAQGGLNTIRVQGSISQNTSTVTVVAPGVSITPTRTTVNNWVTYEVINFPANSPVSITWRRLSGSTIDMGTVNTDGAGAATGQFRVPATTGGPGQIITFSSGNVSETAIFEVAPRVKVTPTPVGRGEVMNVSLRGFARQEDVRIRWRPLGGGSWIVLASGRTSNSGSTTIQITVPDYATDGTYSLRAETASFNQQTNVVMIEGGNPVNLASVDVSTPKPVAEPIAEETPIEIDRSALPLDAPVVIAAVTNETHTPDLRTLLTDANIATSWSGTPDIERNDARLTIDLGSTHTLRGFAWLTQSGGCGELTGLEYSLDGESWTAFDPSMQPGPIGDGLVWRYVASGVDTRFIRFTVAPEAIEQTTIGCVAEVAVWGTAIVVEEAPAETPAATEEPIVEVTPEPTLEPTVEPIEETPIEVEPTEEPAPEPVVEEPVETPDPSA